MLFAEGTQIGKYEILGPIGAGGMGEVFRARDRQLGREVAIKVLSGAFASDPARLRRFELEARSASALNHPNIVTIYEIGDANGVSYIAMEFVEGKTLRELLSSGRPPFKKVLQISTAIADGVARAHAAGIVHRDLKPENVMVTSAGLVKILDFGLAKLTREDSGPAVLSTASTMAVTGKGFIAGTVGYMSPEQAAGEPADFRSDQFVLGVIMYEMAAGKRAFQRTTAVETLSAIIREEPEPIEASNPSIPAPFCWVVNRCLAKEPQERYADTTDLARELRTMQEHLTGAASFPKRPARLRPPRLAWPLLAVALLALGLLASVLVGPRLNIPQPLKVRQLTFRRGTVTSARFAPNGDIVYSAAWNGQPTALYITTKEGPESRALDLPPNTGLFSISSTGEMAVALKCLMNWAKCTGTLGEVPFSGGAPREEEEGILSADWSPNGKELAVVRPANKKYVVEFPRGSGHTLYSSDGWLDYVRFSPHGDQLAVIEHPKLTSAAGSILLIDLAGKMRVLSSGWAIIFSLGWAPDGNKLWFSGAARGIPGAGGGQSIHEVTLAGKEREVYRAPSGLLIEDISADGRQMLVTRASPRAVLAVGGFDGRAEKDLAWLTSSTLADISVDGKTVLFSDFGEGADTPSAYLRKTDGSDAVKLGRGRPLALSPNGRFALVVEDTVPAKVTLLPTGAGQPRSVPLQGVNEIFWGAWFADNSRVVLAGSETGKQPGTYITGTYLFDLATRTTTRILRDGMLGIMVSPDGRSIAANYQGSYFLSPVEGGEPQPIEGMEDSDNLAGWSSDGRFLFVRGANDFRAPLYKVDLRSGKRSLWKTLSPADPSGLIGIGSDPRGVRVTPDGQFYGYTYWIDLNELYLMEGIR